MKAKFIHMALREASSSTHHRFGYSFGGWSHQSHGLHREDLYQIIAYVNSFGTDSSPLVGALIYPDPGSPAEVAELQRLNPWRTSRTNQAVNFLGADCTEQASDTHGMTDGEQAFVDRMAKLLASTA